MTDYVEAKKAKDVIRKMLMANGGSATVTIDNRVRILSLRPGDRPLYTLPWPLKLLQPRTFRYRVLDGDSVVEETSFDRHSVDLAIVKFLDRVPPDHQIVVRTGI